MQRCPETPVNGVSGHQTGALGGIRTPNLLIRRQHIPIDNRHHQRARVSLTRTLEDSNYIV